jgi:hypothetical protein
MNQSVDPQTKIFKAPSLEFLGEQDGPPERLLKRQLTQHLVRHRSVKRTYLARLRIQGQIGVALCICNETGADPALVNEVGKVFASIFGAHEHLDIVFVDDAQEASLEKVCRPFFSSQTH